MNTFFPVTKSFFQYSSTLPRNVKPLLSVQYSFIKYMTRSKQSLQHMWMSH